MFSKISYLLLIFVVFASMQSLGQKKMSLTPFNKVVVYGKLNVRLEKSSSDSIVIESGDFDIEQVKAIVTDSVLEIKLLTEFPPAIKVNVTVYFTQIHNLSVGGGAKIYNRGVIESPVFVLIGKSGCETDLLLAVDSLSVEVNKGAFVRLTGENRIMSLKTSTGGDFRSTQMNNSITWAKITGGTAEINCTDFLDAKVSFGGSLKFVKQPKTINRKEMLGGTIGTLEVY